MKNRKLGTSFLAAVLAVAMIVCLLPSHADAASSSEIKNQINDLKNQRQDIKSQIADLEGQIAANESEIQEMLKQKYALDQQVNLIFEEIQIINDQISAQSLLIADAQDELDEAEIEYKALNEKYKHRIRAMEEEGEVSYWAVLFKANSFSDLLDRLNMVAEIAAADHRRLQELDDAAKMVAAARDALTAERAEMDAAKADLVASQTEAVEKIEDTQRLLKDMMAKGEEFEQLLLESEDEQEKIMQQIAQKEKDFKDAQYLEWLATYVPPTTTAPPTTLPPATQAPTAAPEVEAPTDTPVQPEATTPPSEDASGDATEPPQETEATEPAEPEPTEPEPTQPSAPSTASWITPTVGYYISSPFGMRFHPILGYERMHNGIDMRCDEGNPVYATRAGTVTGSYYGDSGGNVISINHGDGFASIYMHLQRRVVSAGAYVSAGQLIGYVGSTGLSEAPHLHFGISYNGTYVNPLLYIAG